MTIPLEYGKFYHVFNRGNNKEDLFRTEEDYQHFLNLYSVYVAPIADTYAWCLMKNHFHFCVRVKGKNEIGFLDSKNARSQNLAIKWKTSPFIRAENEHNPQPKPVSQLRFLFNAYSKYFNHKYSRTGSLFEKNFERRIIEDEFYLSTLIVYINNNPVKHGLTFEAGQYKWSSFSETKNNSGNICDLLSLWRIFGDPQNFQFVHNKRQAVEYDSEDY